MSFNFDKIKQKLINSDFADKALNQFSYLFNKTNINFIKKQSMYLYQNKKYILCGSGLLFVYLFFQMLSIIIISAYLFYMFGKLLLFRYNKANLIVQTNQPEQTDLTNHSDQTVQTDLTTLTDSSDDLDQSNLTTQSVLSNHLDQSNHLEQSIQTDKPDQTDLTENFVVFICLYLMTYMGVVFGTANNILMILICLLTIGNEEYKTHILSYVDHRIIQLLSAYDTHAKLNDIITYIEGASEMVSLKIIKVHKMISETYSKVDTLLGLSEIFGQLKTQSTKLISDLLNKKHHLD